MQRLKQSLEDKCVSVCVSVGASHERETPYIADNNCKGSVLMLRSVGFYLGLFHPAVETPWTVVIINETARLQDLDYGAKRLDDDSMKDL